MAFDVWFANEKRTSTLLGRSAGRVLPSWRLCLRSLCLRAMCYFGLAVQCRDSIQQGLTGIPGNWTHGADATKDGTTFPLSRHVRRTRLASQLDAFAVHNKPRARVPSRERWAWLQLHFVCALVKGWTCSEYSPLSCACVPKLTRVRGHQTWRRRLRWWWKGYSGVLPGGWMDHRIPSASLIMTLH